MPGRIYVASAETARVMRLKDIKLCPQTKKYGENDKVKVNENVSKAVQETFAEQTVAYFDKYFAVKALSLAPAKNGVENPVNCVRVEQENLGPKKETSQLTFVPRKTGSRLKKENPLSVFSKSVADAYGESSTGQFWFKPSWVASSNTAAPAPKQVEQEESKE